MRWTRLEQTVSILMSPAVAVAEINSDSTGSDINPIGQKKFTGDLLDVHCFIRRLRMREKAIFRPAESSTDAILAEMSHKIFFLP